MGKPEMAYSCASCLLAAVSSQSMARISRTPQYLCANNSSLASFLEISCQAELYRQLHLLVHVAPVQAHRSDTPWLLKDRLSQQELLPYPVVQTSFSSFHASRLRGGTPGQGAPARAPSCGRVRTSWR